MNLVDYTIPVPVTKTAKRALRSSTKKTLVNKLILTKLDVAVRQAKKSKTREKIILAISLSDKATKKRVIHKNKAARIKSALTKLLPKTKSPVKKPSKRPSKKK